MLVWQGFHLLWNRRLLPVVSFVTLKSESSLCPNRVKALAWIAWYQVTLEGEKSQVQGYNEANMTVLYLPAVHKHDHSSQVTAEL